MTKNYHQTLEKKPKKTEESFEEYKETLLCYKREYNLIKYQYIGELLGEILPVRRKRKKVHK